MVEGDDRAFGHGSQLAEHVQQLVLEALVQWRHLLQLDDEPDLADDELHDLLQERDLLTVACVQLPELSRRVVTDEPGAVGRAFEGVVVDDDEPPVRRQVDVTFDEVAADSHRRAERPHGVLRVLRGIAPVTAQQRPALVVCSLVARADR